MQVNWQKMGFKTKEEYNNFLNEKLITLIQMITKTPELLNVFKRLNNK